MPETCTCPRIDGYRIRRKTCPAHRIPPNSEATCDTCGRILNCVGNCPKGCEK